MTRCSHGSSTLHGSQLSFTDPPAKSRHATHPLPRLIGLVPCLSRVFQSSGSVGLRFSLRVWSRAQSRVNVPLKSLRVWSEVLVSVSLEFGLTFGFRFWSRVPSPVCWSQVLVLGSSLGESRVRSWVRSRLRSPGSVSGSSLRIRSWVRSPGSILRSVSGFVGLGFGLRFFGVMQVRSQVRSLGTVSGAVAEEAVLLQRKR